MMNVQQRIILASGSPQRKAMMQTLGVAFEVMPADIDEQAITAATQKKRAKLVAKAKAEAVAKQLGKKQNAIILAGDTFVIDPQTDRPLEKPKDLDEAREMLRFQSGKELVEYTGVCFLNLAKGESSSETIKTAFTYRKLSELEIETYVTTEPVLTWSAAFCPAYDTGAAMIARVEGSLTSFTHGFPLEFFVPLLQKAGIEI